MADYKPLSPLAGVIAQAAYPDVHPDFTDAGWERMADAATEYFNLQERERADKIERMRTVLERCQDRIDCLCRGEFWAC